MPLPAPAEAPKPFAMKENTHVYRQGPRNGSKAVLPGVRRASVRVYGAGKCKWCGKAFVKGAGIATYCSETCSSLAWNRQRVERAEAGRPARVWTCEDCGAEGIAGPTGKLPSRCLGCRRRHDRERKARQRAMRQLAGKNLLGEVFDRLTVTRYVGKIGSHKMWECVCRCGRMIVTRQARLVTGETRSCGCLHVEQVAALRRTPEGQAPSYHAMHAVLRTRFGAALEYACIDCGDTEQPHEWSYIRGCPDELTEPAIDRSTPLAYCLHVEHFAPRCRECHLAMDRAPLASVRRVRTILLAREATA